MIPLEEAIEIAGERPRRPAEEPPQLTEEEQMRLDYVDAMVEAGIYRGFRGEPFDFRIPAVYEGALMGTPALVGALKRSYESGGWSVAVFPRLEGENVVEWQLVFAPAAKVALPDSAAEAPVGLPAVIDEGEIPLVGELPLRVLVRMPTRGRPAQALRVLQLYREMAGIDVAIEVVVDEDDESMLAAPVLQRLAALDCVVTVGAHKSKVEACNAGRVSEWDVLVLASDDMVPVVGGYALRIAEEMRRLWPRLDGALHFDDGHQHGLLCTLPVIGRHLYNQLGYIYHPDYRSLYCDREQTEVLRAMGRIAYTGEKIIEHRHHLFGQAPVDALYCRNDAYEGTDRVTHDRRRATRRAHAQWGYDSPPLWLSILVCSLPERSAQLGRLLVDLHRQVAALNGGRDRYGSGILDPESTDALEVEVLVDDRDEATTIGEKRQALLERARGHFIAYVDDDDGVAHDYVNRVLTALKSRSDADCASLVGAMTVDGGTAVRFEHSISYGEWRMQGGVHVRPPNHLNAVRRELALRVGFKAQNEGEDFDFSTRLRPLLAREVSTGGAPLYFYWKRTK